MNTMAAPTPVSDAGKIYVTGSGTSAAVYALGGSGSGNQISSHIDPKTVDPEAVSSYDDPNVTLPFSFHHFNVFTGKGTIVDLSGVVAEMERTTGKQFTYEFDLSPERTLDYAQWQASERDRLEQQARNRIAEESPEVEVPIQEAWELVEVLVEESTVRTVQKYRYDLQSEAVTAYEVEMTVREMVPTGIYERMLRPGVRFDESSGKFYRKVTPGEVDPGAIEAPVLPDWVVSRIE